jgi:DNA-binding transcriptional regulator YiaG
MAKKKTGRRGGRTPGQWVHLTKDGLRQWRKDAKISRGKLSEMMGVSSTSVQNWETGRSVPMKRYQMMLADLMKGGAPSNGSSGAGEAVTSGAVARPASGGGGDQVQVARLNATSEILKAYLGAGGKVSQEQLVALTKALRSALV